MVLYLSGGTPFPKKASILDSKLHIQDSLPRKAVEGMGLHYSFTADLLGHRLQHFCEGSVAQYLWDVEEDGEIARYGSFMIANSSMVTSVALIIVVGFFNVSLWCLLFSFIF